MPQSLLPTELGLQTPVLRGRGSEAAPKGVSCPETSLKWASNQGVNCPSLWLCCTPPHSPTEGGSGRESGFVRAFKNLKNVPFPLGEGWEGSAGERGPVELIEKGQAGRRSQDLAVTFSLAQAVSPSIPVPPRKGGGSWCFLGLRFYRFSQHLRQVGHLAAGRQ